MGDDVELTSVEQILLDFTFFPFEINNLILAYQNVNPIFCKEVKSNSEIEDICVDENYIYILDTTERWTIVSLNVYDKKDCAIYKKQIFDLNNEESQFYKTFGHIFLHSCVEKIFADNKIIYILNSAVGIILFVCKFTLKQMNYIIASEFKKATCLFVDEQNIYISTCTHPINHIVIFDKINRNIKLKFLMNSYTIQSIYVDKSYIYVANSYDIEVFNVNDGTLVRNFEQPVLSFCPLIALENHCLYLMGEIGNLHFVNKYNGVELQNEIQLKDKNSVESLKFFAIDEQFIYVNHKKSISIYKY